MRPIPSTALTIFSARVELVVSVELAFVWKSNWLELTYDKYVAELEVAAIQPSTPSVYQPRRNHLFPFDMTVVPVALTVLET